MTSARAPARKKKFGARQNITFIYITVYKAFKWNVYSNTASKHFSAFPF
jgi:hypothetical protein